METWVKKEVDLRVGWVSKGSGICLHAVETRWKYICMLFIGGGNKFAKAYLNVFQKMWKFICILWKGIHLQRRWEGRVRKIGSLLPPTDFFLHQLMMTDTANATKCFQMNLKPNEKKEGNTEIFNFLLQICINQYRTWNGFQWKTSFEKLFDWKTENSLEANQSWESLPSKALGW